MLACEFNLLPFPFKRMGEAERAHRSSLQQQSYINQGWVSWSIVKRDINSQRHPS